VHVRCDLVGALALDEQPQHVELTRRQLLGGRRPRQVVAGGDGDPKDADDVPFHTDRSHDDLELGELTACCLVEAGPPPGSAAERQCCPRLGDRVLISNNPMEALGLSSRVRIDLLVGDVGLLGRSGPKVVEKLRSVAQVLYTNVPGGSRLTEQDGGTALSSPFSLEELKEAIAAALDDLR